MISGPATGSLIHGRRITEPTLLTPGMEVAMGGVVASIQLLSSAAALARGLGSLEEFMAHLRAELSPADATEMAVAVLGCAIWVAPANAPG